LEVLVEGITDAKIGAGVLVALAAGVALVLALEGTHLRPGVHLHVKMQRIGALQEGNKVRIAGLELGEIEHVRLAPPDVVLDLWIAKRHAWLVRDTSEFFVNQPGILGEPYLEVGERRGATEAGTPLADDATVRGVDPPRFDQLLTTGYQNVRAFMDLVHNGLPELTALRAAMNDLEGTVADMESAGLWAAGAHAFVEAKQFAAAMRETGTTPAEVSRGVAAARRTVDEVNTRLAPLGPKLEAISAALDRIAARTGDARFAGFARAIDEARPLVERFERATAAAQAIVAAVNAGQGSIGAFLHDVELGDELKAMTKLLKTQPWRTVGHPQTKGASP
jgi:ABC-type transporter Mla subunit MlaD